MRNSPSVLRRRAEEYRSISRDFATPEVRDSLLRMVDQLERRADAWAKMTESDEKIERV